jgi:hypothetical protein
VEQGEKDDKMFILRSGQAVACIAGEKGEIEVKQYSILVDCVGISSLLGRMQNMKRH